MYGLTNYRKGDFDIFDPFKGFFDNMSADPCRTDIRDEGDRFIMESELPGFNKEDISVDISGNSLTLKAEHKAENEEKRRASISAVSVLTAHMSVPLISQASTATRSLPTTRTVS